MYLSVNSKLSLSLVLVRVAKHLLTNSIFLLPKNHIFLALEKIEI